VQDGAEVELAACVSVWALLKLTLTLNESIRAVNDAWTLSQKVMSEFSDY